MRKNIKIAAILISTAVLAVGCGKSTDKTTSTEATDSATTTEEATTEEATTEDVDYSEYVTLGTYKGIQVTKQEVAEVTDAQVEEQIQSVLTQNPVKAEVTDRDTIAEGDIANIDYEGLLDGVAFEGGTAQMQDLTIGSGQFIEGFEEQLIGVKVGDKVELNVTFPDTYGSTDLAGKAVVFNVTVNSISTETPAELNDEFVQGISDSKTVDEYRTSVLADLTASNEEEAKYAKLNEIWIAVKEGCEIKDYPKDLIDKYTTQVDTDYASYAEQSGVELDAFMTSYFGMSAEDYVKESAAREMIFRLIVKDAGITITDEQFKTKVEELVATYNYESADAFIEANGEDNVKDSMLWEEMLQYLSDNSVEA